MRMDLFKLHDKKDDNSLKKCILARGKNLNNCINGQILKLKSKGWRTTDLINYLIKSYRISSSSAQRLLFGYREWYPLFFIEALLKLNEELGNKFEIQNNVEFLKATNPPVKVYKVSKNLTENLCKIAGAHAADGTLKDSYISITDRHKSNIEALNKWIFEEFGIKYNIKKISDNEYGIRFHSKIISRFFTKILGFPNGLKTYEFNEPEIIENAPYKFRKAYAVGALTFEGGFGIVPQLGLSVINKKFRDSLHKILIKSINSKLIMTNENTNNLWRFWTKCKTREDYLKVMGFFEKGTEKWYKVKDVIDGFNGKVNNFNDAVRVLAEIYPKSNGKCQLLDILFIIKELESTYRYEIAEEICKRNNLRSFGGRWAHSLRYYLETLRNCNIIKSQKGRFGKKKSFGTIVRNVYNFNKNVEEWKLPYRPWLEPYVTK